MHNIIANCLYTQLFLLIAYFYPLQLAAGQAAMSEPNPAPPTEAKKLQVKTDALTLIRANKGLYLHKENYILPLSWSEDYHGEKTEVIFQLSAKIQLLNSRFYFAYSQISFWQAYNHQYSSPFRETNYNPEFFYRFHSTKNGLTNWGTDIGFEHESNGRTVPRSRSWNRVYIAAYKPYKNSLYYMKLWARMPEENKDSPTDAIGDDNPDITDYLGHGEIRISRVLFDDQLISVMLRGNVNKHHGAVSIDYNIPAYSRDLYYQLRLWSGYGESFIDYNQSTIRISLGVMLARW